VFLSQYYEFSIYTRNSLSVVLNLCLNAFFNLPTGEEFYLAVPPKGMGSMGVKGSLDRRKNPLSTSREPILDKTIKNLLIF